MHYPTPDRIVLIDNQDSFSYNLVDALRQLGYPLVVYRNQLPADTILAQLNSYSGRQLLCLSPGPAAPEQAGCLLDVIARASGRIPMLGICLGFQALVVHVGGVIKRAPEPVHGRADSISYRPHPIFAHLPPTLRVARYHSLVGQQLPDTVNVLAAVDDIPMAAEFRGLAAIGLQFHPESILTPHGEQLLAQTVKYLFELSSATRIRKATCKF